MRLGSYFTSLAGRQFALGKLCFPILVTLRLLDVGSASAQPSEGQSSSCASSNSQTVCLEGSGWLSCTSNNGQTSCEGSGGMRCKTDAEGALACIPPEGGRCEESDSRITCMLLGEESPT
jgi:hypothetical protein